MGTQYRVTLTKEEVEELQAFCNKGTHPSRAVLCARALLLLDRGENNSRPWKLEEVSGALGMTTRTLNHLKKRFVTEGLERALNRKPQERPEPFGNQTLLGKKRIFCMECRKAFHFSQMYLIELSSLL